LKLTSPLRLGENSTPELAKKPAAMCEFPGGGFSNRNASDPDAYQEQCV